MPVVPVIIKPVTSLGEPTMIYPTASAKKHRQSLSVRDIGAENNANPCFDWKHASKASICLFMLTFAPLGVAIAQAPAAPAPAAPAAPAPAAPAAAAAVPSAPAGAEPNVTNLGSVTVTGTAIARPDAATALPVTTFQARDLREAGVTSTPQILSRITGSTSNFSPGYSTGGQITGGSSFADLRGLGPSKTLILLNGRRLAVNALNGGATDLNNIPFAAIERVEVLRDGASALYGTDAIGGVINFITKKNLDGGSLDLQYDVPTRGGGGNSTNLSITFGKGDYQKDGWNVMGTLGYQIQDGINTNDRGFVTPLDPRIFAISSNTYPGQYLQGNTGIGFVNPTGGSGCNVPGEVEAGNGYTCYENYTSLGAEVQQKYTQPSFYGRGALKLTENNSVSLSYLWTRKRTRNIAAPSPTSGNISINPSSPYFPGNGITPLPPTAATDDAGSAFDPNSPISLFYRAVPIGPRIADGINQYHRVLLDFTGVIPGGVRYDTAFSYNQSATDYHLRSGSFNQVVGDNSLQGAINNGTFNPFTANPSDSERALINGLQTNGNIESDKTRAYVWDGKIDREIGNWFGSGQSALALGAQYRHETLKSTVDGFIADRALSSGQSASKVDENRDVEGVFGELNIPLLESLELDAQARYDNYSDVGDTLNPKVSLRYQPIEQLTLRASYAEGFHAPTLYDLYQPQVETFSSGGLNDPILCPGGNVAAGGVATRDCNQQFRALIGGNPDLAPEKSKSWSAGFILQPVKYASLTVDFWAVELSQQIGALDYDYIFNNYDQYSGNFNRNSNGAIDNFTNLADNQGKTETNGEDVQLNVSVPTMTGTYALTLKGTYINKYDTQIAKNSAYTNNLNQYELGSVIFRWKHSATLSWSKGPVALGVVNHLASGYEDYNPNPGAPGRRNVNPYVTWDTYGTYNFENGISMTLGSNNVFNQDPPFSLQNAYGNSGYDARYADGVGRVVYGRFSYSF